MKLKRLVLVAVVILAPVVVWRGASLQPADRGWRDGVPLDQFSAKRLMMLQAMAACEAHPGEDFVGGGDVMYICNPAARPPAPYRPASAPELPLPTFPTSGPAK